MRVSICVPWIETQDEWRSRARTWTERFWTAHGLDVVYGTGPSRAAARNDAARRTDAEVLFFADADTWVPVDQLHRACERAATGFLVLAYTDHIRLSRKVTQSLLNDQDVPLQGQKVGDCPGGALAVSRELLGKVGGHDERFSVWGGEDRSFLYACTVMGGSERLPGLSYHLWHVKDPLVTRTNAQRRAGVELGKRYKRAAGVKGRSGILPRTDDASLDVAAMVEILEEPGGPLHQDVASAHG